MNVYKDLRKMLNIEKHLTLNKYKNYFKTSEKTFHQNIHQANRS